MAISPSPPVPSRVPPRPLPPPGDERSFHLTAGTLAALGLAFVAYQLWTATGARLALFVGAAAVTAVGLDLVWSAWATARVSVSVSTETSDAMVGDRIPLRVSVRGPGHLIVIRVRGDASTAAVVDCPGDGWLYSPAVARGILTGIGIEVTSSGLAGLLRCTRHRVLALGRPVWVGPRPIVPAGGLREGATVWGDRQYRASSTGDAVRGIRPYQPGDARGRVHWRATARHGQLVVKELDEPGAPRLLIVVDLRPGGGPGEAAASRAAGYAREALRAGFLLTLSTCEAQGAVVGRADSPRLVGRRLAAAVIAPTGPPIPDGWDKDSVLVVGAGDDRWR